MKKILNQKGFTFIELLAVVGIVIFIGTAVVMIMSITFRGSKKSDAILILRQNGNSALAQMSNSIRYAKSVVSPLACVPSVQASSVTIISAKDNSPTTYSCTGGLSSNSASLVDANNVTVSACSFTCSQQSTYNPPTISIEFTLQPKNQNSLVETTATIPFKTSVTLRNYNP